MSADDLAFVSICKQSGGYWDTRHTFAYAECTTSMSAQPGGPSGLIYPIKLVSILDNAFRQWICIEIADTMLSVEHLLSFPTG